MTQNEVSEFSNNSLLFTASGFISIFSAIATGVEAVGGIATGVDTVGGIATGVDTIGGIATGVDTIGVCAVLQRRRVSQTGF